MLLIKEGESTHLPKEYHSTNNLCAHIYDLLTDFFRYDEYHTYLMTTPLILNDNNEEITLDNLQDNKHILDWLSENGKNSELETVLVKHLTLSILQDFVNFIYESLKCAQKGKFTVAYSLLRKPLTDELLILEQLLVDRDTFIHNFFHIGDPKLYDPSSKSNPINKKEIIQKSTSEIENSFFSAEHIYNLRYNKDCEYGINGISNKALHIVTGDKSYKTLDQNLNFVFSNQNDYKSYFKHYYSFMPYLLLYSTAIVDQILFAYLPEEKHRIKRISRKLKRVIAVDYLFTDYNNKIIELLAETLQLECQKCGRDARLTKEDFDTFFISEQFFCPHCENPSSLDLEMSELFNKILK